MASGFKGLVFRVFRAGGLRVASALKGLVSRLFKRFRMVLGVLRVYFLGYLGFMN